MGGRILGLLVEAFWASLRGTIVMGVVFGIWHALFGAQLDVTGTVANAVVPSTLAAETAPATPPEGLYTSLVAAQCNAADAVASYNPYALAQLAYDSFFGSESRKTDATPPSINGFAMVDGACKEATHWPPDYPEKVKQCQVRAKAELEAALAKQKAALAATTSLAEKLSGRRLSDPFDTLGKITLSHKMDFADCMGESSGTGHWAAEVSRRISSWRLPGIVLAGLMATLPAVALADAAFHNLLELSLKALLGWTLLLAGLVSAHAIIWNGDDGKPIEGLGSYLFLAAAYPVGTVTIASGIAWGLQLIAGGLLAALGGLLTLPVLLFATKVIEGFWEHFFVRLSDYGLEQSGLGQVLGRGVDEEKPDEPKRKPPEKTPED